MKFEEQKKAQQEHQREIKDYQRPDLPCAAPEQRCSLVMKGGVTSGVVFPGTVRVLAATYRFKRLGGTSAGAIAAAFAAAAEYRRRERGCNEGFEAIWQISEELSKKPEAGAAATKLEALFTPNPRTEGLFGLITAGLDGQHRWQRLWQVLLRHYLWATLALGLAALVLLAGLVGLVWFGSHSLLATRLLVMGGVLVVLGLVNFLSTVFYGGHGRLVLNHFGLSTGFEPAEDVQQEPPEAWRFTMWLHHHLKKVSGLERPLTFGDLAPQEYAGLPSGATGEAHSIPFKVVESVREHRERIQDDIELKQVTTCISLGRPYVLPFDPGLPDAENFYFCKDEWKAFLPAELLQHLMAHSPQTLTLFVDEQKKEQRTYHQLPPPQDLPVVLTTRLSMSFPGLFSAMPMYFIRQRPHQHSEPLASGWQLLEGQQRCANCQKVYFGDGGLTINFPLMLFDELVPADPTFALNLVPTTEGQELPEPRVVWREGRNDDGVYLMPPQPLKAFDQPEEDHVGGWQLPVVPFKHLLAYVMGLFESARNWGDNALIPLPGYSERIAHITLPPFLGGLNLRMTGDAIDILRYKGAVAGELLVQRFHNDTMWNWKIHRAAHFMTLTADLEALVQEYALEFGPQGTLKMDGLGGVPMQGNTVFSGLTPNQAERIQAFIEAGAAGTFFSGYRRRKGPRGMLRYRPRL